MNKLLTYLKEEFPTPDQTLVSRFWDNFGVKVRKEGNLFQFKYHQLKGDFQQKITHFCRGQILEFDSDKGWSIRSRPFDKFFGLSSGYCPLHSKKDFQRHRSQLEVVEKADGSLIQLWWDGEAWRVSTMGTITTEKVRMDGPTLEELFFQVTSFKTGGLPELQSYTLMLELCTTENQVLTEYSQDCIYFLGARHIHTGEYLSVEDPLLDAFFQRCHNLVRPYRENLLNLGVENLEEFQRWVEKESLKTGQYGKWPEGFILYNEGIPVAKIKNTRYSHRVAFKAVSRGTPKNNLIIRAQKKVREAFFGGYLDDMEPFLTPELKTFALKYAELKQKQIKAVEEHIDHMFEIGLPSKGKKEMGLYLKGKKELKPFSTFFFRVQKDTPQEMKEAFSEWLQKNPPK